jgi:hypothetical protein
MAIATSQDAEGFQRADDLLDDDALLSMHPVLLTLLVSQQLPSPLFMGGAAAFMPMLDPLIAAISQEDRVGMRGDSPALVERKVMLASFPRAYVEDLASVHGDLGL